MKGMRLWDPILAEISKPENWLRWSEDAIHVVIILAGAWVLTRVIHRMLLRLRGYILAVMDKRGDGATGEMEKRATTIVAVLNKVTGMVIWVFALVWALFELGFRIEPLLAGLGVAGIAVGLGAQTLIKDWLGGLFILIEDQLRIGDGVLINGIAGTVEEINLRTTILRGEDGAVNIISNGSITSLANKTRGYSYFIFEATLAHGADAERALEILREEGERIEQELPYKNVILAPMEVMGIDRLGDRGVTIKARIKTLPAQQGALGRELNRRVKAKLDAAGIAFPHMIPAGPPQQ
jgi:small conductance mechanosensitive channel